MSSSNGHVANARRVWRQLVERAERESWSYHAVQAIEQRSTRHASGFENQLVKNARRSPGATRVRAALTLTSSTRSLSNPSGSVASFPCQRRDCLSAVAASDRGRLG